MLVVAGLAIGFIPGVPHIHVTPETISLIVLPPLLYAAGEELAWPELRRSWKPVAALAIGLVPASAAAVALVAIAVTPVPWVLAFVLGAVLSATDPVAVTALGRKLALPQRLQTLVQAESLFNDATSLLLFRVSATIAISAAAVTWQGVVGEFALLALGGAVCGAVVAGVVGFLRRRTEEPVVESVITLVTLGPLVRRVSLAVPRENLAEEYRSAWSRLIVVGQGHLDQLEELQALAPVLIERARHSLRGRDHTEEGEHITTTYAQLRRDLVGLLSRELEVLHRAGTVTEATRRRIQRDLDLEAARYTADDH